MKNLPVLPSLLLVAGLAAGFADHAGAQATSSPVASPFRPGQWGIEGYLSALGGGGAVLRFTNPRTAIVFDVSGSGSRTNYEDAAGAASRQSSYNVHLSLGLRHYATVAPRIVGIFGGGVDYLKGAQHQELPSGTTSSARSTLIGAYGEAGGQFMVTDYLAVGMSYVLSARRAWSKSHPGSIVGHGFDYGMSVRPIRVTFYF